MHFVASRKLNDDTSLKRLLSFRSVFFLFEWNKKKSIMMCELT